MKKLFSVVTICNNKDRQNFEVISELCYVRVWREIRENTQEKI